MDAIAADGRREREIIGRTALTDTGLAEVSIEDSGPGVPADRDKQVFEPFFTTKTTGMGMGLAIARTIVERHGGRIWLENKGAGGAIFRFTLPIARRPAPAPNKQAGVRAQEPTATSQLGGTFQVSNPTARALRRLDTPSAS
jgi:signal transduction histidine kinase